MPNVLDYTNHPNLSWLVARRFRDRETGEVYFVNQFPPDFEEDHYLLVTYHNRTMGNIKLERHLFDMEVNPTSARSSPKYTSSFSNSHNAIYRDMKRSRPLCTAERRTALALSPVPVSHPIDLEGYFSRQNVPKKPRIC